MSFKCLVHLIQQYNISYFISKFTCGQSKAYKRLFLMSENIDFIMPCGSVIERPAQKHRQANRQVRQLKQQRSLIRTFEIEKSFVPQKKSLIHEKMRPQIEKIKALLKAQREKEKRIRQMLAQGIIDRKDLQPKHNENVQISQQTEEKHKLTVDEYGQLRDEKGNLIFVKNETIQLKINQKKAHEKQAKQLDKKQRIKYHEKLARNIQDQNLVVSSKMKIRRSTFGLQFLQQGSCQPLDSQTKTQAHDLNRALKAEEETLLIKRRRRTDFQFKNEIPDVEWWDQQILKMQAYEKECKSTNNIQLIDFSVLLNIEELSCPVMYRRVGDEDKKSSKMYIPMYLTKDERKRLRRKKKKQKLEEKNDMIRLGLIEPDKPKLKIGNLAIVMKNQLIMDPSKVEQQAKKQMQERLNRHLQANSSRKLTKVQKKQKMIKKLKKDAAKQCRRIAFLVKKLDNPSHLFKVNTNARQLALSGFILKPKSQHGKSVLVMAQGGQKAIRFFKNLMLSRIKWEEDQNSSKLIWEGEIDHIKLGKWRTIQFGDESEAIKSLKEKQVESFYQYLS